MFTPDAQPCYVVCSHEHDGFHVCEVFADYDAAKSYADQMGSCVPRNVVDEFKVILARFHYKEMTSEK